MIRAFLLALLAQTIPLGGIPVGVSGPSLIQHAFYNGSACVDAISCAVSSAQGGLASTTAGNLLVVLAMASTDNVINYSSITGESGWAHCSGFPYSIVQGGNFNQVDCAYTLSAAGGATSLTWNWNSNQTYQQAIEVLEFHKSGTWSYVTDAGGTDTACTACAGAALTLSAGSYVTVQFISGSQVNVTAVTGGYTADFGTYSNGSTAGFGVGWLLNATSGAAPNWTQATSQASAVGGLAFQ